MADISTQTEIQSTEVENPKKKANGCLIALLVLVAILALLAGGIYLGYKKITSSLEPKDLGVTYTQQDYQDFIDMLNIEASPDTLCIGCPAPQYSDPVETSFTISSAQASAAFESINQNMQGAKISNTQILFSDDKAEITTTLTYQGQTFPIYLSGNISKSTDTSITGEIYDLKAGGLPVPSSIKSMAQEGLLNIMNDSLAAAGDNFRIDELKLTSSGLMFEGLFPSKIK